MTWTRGANEYVLSIRLPDDADRDKVKVQVAGGALEVHVPRARTERPAAARRDPFAMNPDAPPC